MTFALGVLLLALPFALVCVVGFFLLGRLFAVSLLVTVALVASVLAGVSLTGLGSYGG